MNIYKSLTVYGSALFFVLLAVFLSNLLTAHQNPAPQTPISVRPLVSCPPDFLSYQSLSDRSGHVVKLIGERKRMFASNGEFINSQVVITKSETKTSKVACGYLFVRAGTKQGALKTWEDVVINPNGFGGHLDPESAISINDGEQYSEYLYSLNKIQYWPSHNRQQLNTADWAALLNVSESVPFEIALNTENTSGFIDNVSIAYKCWNPQTGEENDGCALNVTKSSDSSGSSIQ